MTTSSSPLDDASRKAFEEAERALEPFSEAAQACELWKHPDFIFPIF